MNIFVLDQNPVIAARDHCDKHVVKMILEYGQMLSTAHRLLDCKMSIHSAVNPLTGKVVTRKLWLYEGERAIFREFIDEEGDVIYRWVVVDPVCYQVAHANHPCSVWARDTSANYSWLFKLFEACLNEYSARYGKKHSAERIYDHLSATPSNIYSGGLTPFAQAMPEEFKHEDAVEAYRRFYVGAKARFAKWRYTETPEWFKHRMEGQNAADLAGTP